ncbi:MAG: alkylmercury lyase [Chitinispirillaceae bacterium]|jgi:hypothetical protein
MIEFQYFNGCPNSAETLNNLKELIEEGMISEREVIISEIPDIASAEKYNFQGSPTILIDGMDIYTEKRPTGFNYTCRVYEFNGKKTGILPKKYIEEK